MADLLEPAGDAANHRASAVRVALAALALLGVLLLVQVPPARADTGSFSLSDPLLNRLWSASVQTAIDMLAPGPLATDALGRPCPIVTRRRPVQPPTILLPRPTQRCRDAGATARAAHLLAADTCFFGVDLVTLGL